MRLIAVVTTVKSIDDARRLATLAVESRLAACVQFEPIESVYAWKGQIEQAVEVRLTFKTTQQRWTDLQRLLESVHPYETPAIYCVAVADASAPYAAWVREYTGPPPT